MPTILHISDLHRTSGPRLHNEELLAAIASDSRRWRDEGIPNPDVIVVSGDLVQGASLSCTDPETEITLQYAEAEDFLRKLAAEFVDSDHSRVIIVPGNHDVVWARALAGMRPMSTCPAGIAGSAFEAESGLRWDWANQQAYEITDRSVYDSRCDLFRQFRTNFYAGLDPDPLAYDPDLVFADYPALGMAIVGFPTWHGNDCFCDVGEINSDLVARSRRILMDTEAPVAVAVWHHNVVGGPRARDYMDQRVIHQLIDFGFSVGLHGHQHHPGAAPFQLRLPNLTSMAVVGAGSLAVGDSELPMGERRQFNVVVLEPAAETITVHVRAMSREGVFAGSYRDDFGGNTYVALELPPSPSRPREPSAARRLDDAIAAVAAKDYNEALKLLNGLGASFEAQKRQIETQALAGLGRDDELIALLRVPRTADEAVRLIALLVGQDRFDEADAALSDARDLLDEPMIRDLSSTIAVRRTMQ